LLITQGAISNRQKPLFTINYSPFATHVNLFINNHMATAFYLTISTQQTIQLQRYLSNITVPFIGDFWVNRYGAGASKYTIHEYRSEGHGKPL